jgi:hypothetical protein
MLLLVLIRVQPISLVDNPGLTNTVSCCSHAAAEPEHIIKTGEALHRCNSLSLADRRGPAAQAVFFIAFAWLKAAAIPFVTAITAGDFSCLGPLLKKQ